MSRISEEPSPLARNDPGVLATVDGIRLRSARLAAAWSKREFHSSYERPLILLAGLRYVAPSDAGAHPLVALVPHAPSRSGLAALACGLLHVAMH